MLTEFRRRLLDIVECNDYIASFADPKRQIADIDNYTYTVDKNDTATTITNIASQSFNLVMDTDSDFVCCSFSGIGRVQGSTGLVQNPAMLVQINDKSTGRSFFNQPAPMALIAGQGGYPFFLTSPRVIKPRTTLVVTAIAAQAAIFDGFYFAISGGRIFYRN